MPDKPTTEDVLAALGPDGAVQPEFLVPIPTITLPGVDTSTIHPWEPGVADAAVPAEFEAIAAVLAGQEDAVVANTWRLISGQTRACGQVTIWERVNPGAGTPRFLVAWSEAGVKKLGVRYKWSFETAQAIARACGEQLDKVL